MVLDYAPFWGHAQMAELWHVHFAPGPSAVSSADLMILRSAASRWQPLHFKVPPSNLRSLKGHGSIEIRNR
jgi:hypothetical protein